MPNTLQHIAIILDGNRRWARQHGLELFKGHNQVVDSTIEPLVDRCIELGVSNLTLWAFSTENWNRDPQEVSWLMALFRRMIEKNGERLHQKGVRLSSIGDLSKFPDDIQLGIAHWKEMTKDNSKITVRFALNYGGRDELLRAMNAVVTDLPAGQQITAEMIAAHLDTAGVPDPDLIIRPGGEKRLSGFMPWQSVYSELYFTDVLMPDFSPTELDKAIAEFHHRQRRFGK